MSGTNKWSVCRICLKDRGLVMQNIYAMDEADSLTNLVERIQTCGGVRIDASQMDELPNLICEKCLLLLRIAHKFRTSCQRSDRILRNFFTQNEKPLATTANTAITEHIKTFRFVLDNATTQHVQLENVPLSGAPCDVEDIERQNVFEDIEAKEEKEMSDVEYYTDADAEEEEFATDDNIQLVAITNTSNPNISNEFKIVTRLTDAEQSTSQQLSNSAPNTSKPRKSMRRSTQNTANNKFICSICGNVYVDKTKLNMHLKIHNQVKPHECEICHKRFAQTPQLSRHMNSHTGNRPYKCTYCTSSFADPSTLCKHERIHTNERPYQCEICGKAFSYTNVLKVHMMVHTGEKPYRCIYCKKQFSQAHHMRIHQKRHEQMEDGHY